MPEPLARLSSRRRRGRQTAPYRIAFANINETQGVRIEGLGFTGLDVRRSFELAARTLPVDIIYYDNAGDEETAVSNAADAISKKVDLLIEYNGETAANPEIARKAAAAGIPVLAINYPVGDAPLYGADNHEAGRIAGHALGAFTKQSWPDDTPVAVILGDLGDPSDAVGLRIKGITEGLHAEFPDVEPTMLDSGGQPQRGDDLLTKYMRQQPRRKVLVATLDDATALWARTAVEVAVRINDCVIVSQGLDRSIHGGAHEKKEIDPDEPRQRGPGVGRLLHGPVRLRRAAARAANAEGANRASAYVYPAYPCYWCERVPGISANRYELTQRAFHSRNGCLDPT